MSLFTRQSGGQRGKTVKTHSNILVVLAHVQLKSFYRLPTCDITHVRKCMLCKTRNRLVCTNFDSELWSLLCSTVTNHGKQAKTPVHHFENRRPGESSDLYLCAFTCTYNKFLRTLVSHWHILSGCWVCDWGISVHKEDCEGCWLSGCCSSVAQHWLHKPGVLGSIPSNCWPFSVIFASKHLN